MIQGDHPAVIIAARLDGVPINHQPIGWYLVVKLESLLGRSDGREHRLTVDARLDVGCSALSPINTHAWEGQAASRR